MEYIAIRENQRLELINEQTKAMQCQHEGNSWGANTPKSVKSHLNLSAAKLPEAVPLFQITSTIQKATHDCRS
jgi:hypothetical protein